MLNRLRIRFAAFTMAALVIVIAAIITLINVLNYNSVAATADEVLDSLAEHGGRFPNNFPPHGGGMNEETPFETRYFSVHITGDRYDANTSMISKVNADEAIRLAKQVQSGKSTRGYAGQYRYYVTTDGNSYLLVFMDCSRLLSAAGDFLGLSIFISLAGAAVVAVILILLSKRIVAPIAYSYMRQKEFITNASHELKTPLTIISANSEILELENGKNKSIDSIQRQVTRMTTMVKNMSSLAMLEESGVNREMSKFDLSEAVRDVAEQIFHAANGQGKDTAESIDGNIMYVGDEDLIRRLVGILLDNALKYSVSRIFVRLVKNKNRIELTVKNDTAGVEKGGHDKDFERFFRSDSARASGKEGCGIGLSAAKEIVAIHKGKITAYSPDGNEYIINTKLF